MRRSVNLRMTEQDAMDLCRVHNVPFFSTMSLPLGGTRVFCRTERGADELRLRFCDLTLPGGDLSTQ